MRPAAATARAEVDLAVEEDRLAGTVGGEPFEATRESDPPSPGTAKPLIPTDLEGEYGLTPESACLGGAVELSGGDTVHLEGDGAEGTLDYSDGELSGTVTCAEGGEAEVVGSAADRTIDLEITPAGARAGEPAEAAGATEHVVAEKEREFPRTLAAFFIAVAVVMLVARLFGAAAARIGQPRVMGEVVAGIALGPTLLGAVSPELQALIFPTDIIPLIGVVANLGLIFYMFLVGLELDPKVLSGRMTQAARDLQRLGRAADGARHRGGPADLLAAGARHRLHPVRPLHGRGDVDHRLPGAGEDPGRAADAAQARSARSRWHRPRSTTSRRGS